MPFSYFNFHWFDSLMNVSITVMTTMWKTIQDSFHAYVQYVNILDEQYFKLNTMHIHNILDEKYFKLNTRKKLYNA